MYKMLLLLLLPLVSGASVLTGSPDRDGEWVWSDEGSWARYDLTVYEPKQPTGSWFVVGQRAQNNYDDLASPIYAMKDNTAEGKMLATPKDFAMIWDDRGSTALRDGSAWRAVCPNDFVALGDFFLNENRISKVPDSMFSKIRCVHQNLTELCAGWGVKSWDTDGMGGDYSASVWPVTPLQKTGLGGFFFANNGVNRPPPVLPRCLKLSAVKFL